MPNFRLRAHEMTRSVFRFSISLSLCLALSGTAAGQAMVEYGLGAGRAATTTAPAGGIGKSIGGLAGSLEKALNPGKQPPADRSTAATATTVTRSVVKTPPVSATPSAAPARNWEDPGAIEPSLAYEDLVRRFGPPAMSITNMAERLLTYRGTDGVFQVTVRDGQVATIDKARR
jgi:hypothetical protein